MASGDKIYEQLNTLKLSDVSATNINKVTEPLHLQKTNEDALRTTVLLNDATMRNDGAPIPGTSYIEQVTYDDGGANVSSFFSGGAGEVWRVMSITYTSTGGASTLKLYVQANSRFQIVAQETVDGTGGALTVIADPYKDIYLDENSQLKVTVSVDDSTSEMLQAYLIRVR